VEDSRLSIGEVARTSGLPVSALRFYDGAGVLVPASVDPRNGYRRYGPDQVAAARLIARLRRVGMPLDAVRALLAGTDPGPVLDAHLARLEDGLDAARRELSAVRALLDRSEPVMSFSVPAAELAAALTAVRYAVGTDPAYPALHGILLDVSGGTLHVVATDRYRLAVATVPTAGAPDARCVLPAAFADEIRALLATPADGLAEIRAEGDDVTMTAGGRSVRGTAAADEYPDWRRLEPPAAAHRVRVDGPALRAAVVAGAAIRKDRAGVEYDAIVLTLDGGELAVGGAGELAGGGGELPVGGESAVGGAGELAGGGAGDTLRVGVNRDFLLDALAGHDQLTLELDSPITPLAIRIPDRSDWSLLMPVSLAGPAAG
jgi:DNA-binding transcriptional MerR regulator